MKTIHKAPSPQRFEEAFLTSWPALRLALYDGWLLRFSGGYTKRANSVQALYGSSLDLETKIDHCEAAYRAHDLPVLFRVTPYTQPASLDAALAARGYTRYDRSLVLWRPVDDGALRQPSEAVSVAPHLDDWLADYWRLSETSYRHRETHRAILDASPAHLIPVRYLVGGTVVSCALGIVAQGFVGLYDMVTAAGARRHGYATELVQSTLYWARQVGAEHAYLQVVAENVAARALYGALGYRLRYDYWYRMSPEN